MEDLTLFLDVEGFEISAGRFVGRDEVEGGRKSYFDFGGCMRGRG